MNKSVTCRRVRAWLQDRHDREIEDRRVQGREVEDRQVQDLQIQVHLEGCASCRRFREFLSGFGRELADSLDAEGSALPQTDPAAWLASSAAPRLTARRAVPRWAIPAAAAALLAIAVGTQAPRLASGARVQRSIRAETAALVEELFSRPLAQGVEAGLAGAGQLEGLSQGDGLQGLGEGEEPAAPAAEPLSP